MRFYYNLMDRYDGRYVLDLLAGPDPVADQRLARLTVVQALKQTLQRNRAESVWEHSMKVFSNYRRRARCLPLPPPLPQAQLQAFLILHDIGKLIDYSLHSYYSFRLIQRLLGRRINAKVMKTLCLNHLLFGFLYEGIFSLPPAGIRKWLPPLAHFQRLMRLAPGDLLTLCESRETLAFLLFGYTPAEIQSLNPAFDEAHYEAWAGRLWRTIDRFQFAPDRHYFKVTDPKTRFELPLNVDAEGKNREIRLGETVIGRVTTGVELKATWLEPVRKGLRASLLK